MSVNNCSSTKLPVIYVTHGAGPMMLLNAPPIPILGEIDRSSPAAQWFRQLTKQLAFSSPPKAILVITAHWETENSIHINAQEKHEELFYDYYGFPAEAYQLQYKPAGDPALANRVKELLDKAKIPTKLDRVRNLDHGVFIPLKLIYPNANIPVVSMSIFENLSPSEHLKIGKALQPLRDEGVLIIGSGSSVHGFNLSSHQSDAFMKELIDALTKVDPEKREKLLLTWEKSLPFARENHPREEHFIPLHVVVGAAGTDSGHLLNPNVINTQASFAFGL